MRAMARLIACAVAATMAATLSAAVDMVTLPRREGVQLTIYSGEDITMVREHRLLTIKQGVNRIQFTWANTLIDPTSIDFRILDRQGDVDLIDTTFPSGRNDALQWNIQSRVDGKVAVEIRYFTSGTTWDADYVGLANEDETRLQLTGYVRIYNNSGETYDHAEVRLVVGNVNLVEKIKDLATRPAPYPGQPPEARAAMRLALDAAVLKAEAAQAVQEKPKEVIKEGLSEYFLFTIEGRETIEDKVPKRLVALNATGVPLECIYKISDRTPATSLTKFYRFKNVRLVDAAGKLRTLPAMENLGLSPLPNGTVRLFSEYANRDLAYVGGTTVRYVPIGDRVEVDVGLDPDITLVRRLKDQQITDLIARQYSRLVNDRTQYYDLLDYDETYYWEEELVSGKKGPVMVNIERTFDDQVILWGEGAKPRDWDSNAPGAYVNLHEIESRVEAMDKTHVTYFLDLRPGLRRVVTYTVTCKRRRVGPELNVHF